jgi:hypothetical protein
VHPPGRQHRWAQLGCWLTWSIGIDPCGGRDRFERANADDQLETLQHSYLTPDLGSSEPPVQARVLPGGYLYIRVSREGVGLRQLNPLQIFQQAIADAVERNAPGVIIDVRGNTGGADQMVADMAGYFYSHPAVYEKLAPYDRSSGQADTSEAHTIVIEPRAPHYGGPIAVLIDPGTRSSMALRTLQDKQRQFPGLGQVVVEEAPDRLQDRHVLLVLPTLEGTRLR